MNRVEQVLRSLDEDYPLVPHTHAGRLSSTVRRMKAEKELGVPINRRTGFAVSVKHGKPANELDESSWEEFYQDICHELRERYPDLHRQVFG